MPSRTAEISVPLPILACYDLLYQLAEYYEWEPRTVGDCVTWKIGKRWFSKSLLFTDSGYMAASMRSLGNYRTSVVFTAKSKAPFDVEGFLRKRLERTVELFRKAVLKNMRLFISYRREDSSDVSGRIYDRLIQHFGPAGVFKDVDSIPFGVDFRKCAIESLTSCSFLLAVLGNRWISLRESNSGLRRIDNPNDFVRVEIEVALELGISVIPLLVQGARMPSENVTLSHFQYQPKVEKFGS